MDADCSIRQGGTGVRDQLYKACSGIPAGAPPAAELIGSKIQTEIYLQTESAF